MRQQRFKMRSFCAFINKQLPTILLVLTTLLLGLMNTVFVKAEDEGSWRIYVGCFFLLIAAVNIVLLIIRLRKTRG